MSTEKVDGFRLDRIGQLLSTSYPELRLTPGLGALTLRRFAPGVPAAPRRPHPARGRAGGQGSARGARGALHVVRALAGGPQGDGGRARAPVGGAVDRPGWAPRSAGSRRPPSSGSSPAPRCRPPRRSPSAGCRPARSTASCARCSPRCCATPGRLTSSRCADLGAARLRERPAGRAGGRRGGTCRSCWPARCRRAPCTPGCGTSGSTTSVTTAEHGSCAAGRCCWRRTRRAAAELLPGLRVPDFHPVTVVHHTTDDPAAASRRVPRCCWTPTGAGRGRTRRCSATWTRAGRRAAGC